MKTLIYAWRFLSRAKSYTFINLLGLSLSLACVIVLVRYIHRELSVDTNCVDRDGVYAVQVDINGNHYYGSFEVYQDSALIAPSQGSVRFRVFPLEDDHVVSDGHRFRCNAIATDSTFFRLFTYRTLQGKAMSGNPNSVVLTEHYARKLYGNSNPIGRLLRFSNGNDYVVTGVVALPENKTWMNFDMVLPNTSSNRWQRMPLDFYRFVPRTDMERLCEIGSRPRRINARVPDDLRQYTFRFVSVRECYWNNPNEGENTPLFLWGNREQLYIFIGICVMLLFTGLLNFVNLYMIYMLRRTREYGIRRVFGAGKYQMFLHILTENFLLIILAVWLAWTIVELTQSSVEKCFGISFSYSSFDGWLTLFIILFLPLIASLWPYWRFTHDMPSVSISSVGTVPRSVRSRMVLLFLQYMVTFLLVVLALYFNRQLDLLLHTDPGYRTEDILVANLIHESGDYAAYRDEDEWKAANEREKQIAEMVARCPDIDCWTVDGETLTSSDYAARFEGFEGQTAYINVWYATPDFFRLYDLHFVEGGLPDTDDGWDECYVVNRAGLKALGYESCSGATVVDKDGDAQVYPIVGVIDNYYDGRITSGIRPMVFIVSRYTSGHIFQMVVHPGRLPAVLDYLRKLEREVYGTEEFEYYMFADRVRQMYESDRQTAVLYNVFAFMAIMVSCLGLFGISLFDMRQRYREIAIRKVNGAGRKELYRLLFRKYLLILGAAFLMAVPLSCYMIGIYTEGLTVKAPLTAGMFLFAFAVVTVLTVGTLFWQVHKAARINPAEVMKSE